RPAHGQRTASARPAHGQPPDRGEDEEAILPCGSVANLLVGEAVVATAPLETGRTRGLSGLDAAEEGLERPTQPGQYVLQHLGVDVAIVRPNLFAVWQLGALSGDGDAHPAFLPGIATLLKSSIVEFPAAAQDNRHRLLLTRSRPQLILE